MDAELGILLRCEEILDGKPLRVTELAFIRVDPAPVRESAPFRPPGGWDSVADSGPPSTPNGPGREVAKLTAGLAAGGLGALIKHAPFRPFETATREEAEAEMPSSDGPLPADAPPASDEVLRLLYSSPDLWSPGITATLHQWHDVAAMLAKLPDSARRAGFGGLGVLVDAAGERIATVHTILRLRLGGSGQYRIEPVLYPGRPGRPAGHWPEAVICDGERRWRIGEEEVVTGPATALPREIANLFDTSWLLEHQLTGDGEVTTGGRTRLPPPRGFRLAAGRVVLPVRRRGGCRARDRVALHLLFRLPAAAAVRAPRRRKPGPPVPAISGPTSRRACLSWKNPTRSARAGQPGQRRRPAGGQGGAISRQELPRRHPRRERTLTIPVRIRRRARRRIRDKRR